MKHARLAGTMMVAATAIGVIASSLAVGQRGGGPPANLPDKPSFPNRPLFAAGGLGGGLALGLVISFLLEMKDSSLKTERDVEFALRLPVLAMIPELEATPAENVTKKEEPVLAGVGAGPGQSERA